MDMTKLNMTKIKARVGVGLAAAVAVVASQPALLATHAGQIALGIVFLAGTVSPERVSPKTVEMATKAGAAVMALVNAPKAARQAQVQAIVEQAVAASKAAGTVAATEVISEAIKNKTMELSVGELGGIVGKAVEGEAAKLEAGTLEGASLEGAAV